MDNACELKELIDKRKSYRSFLNKKISVDDFMDLFLAGYSAKPETDRFSIPLAGGLNSMELTGFLKVKNEWVLCEWDPLGHTLYQRLAKSFTPEKLFYANSTDFKQASAVIIISSRLEIIYSRYMNRAYKFACIQAGHIAQNILLLATKRRMRTLVLGLLNQEEVASACALSVQKPLYAIILG